MEDVENCFGVNKSPFRFKGKQIINHVTFVDHMTVITESIVIFGNKHCGSQYVRIVNII